MITARQLLELLNALPDSYLDKPLLNVAIDLDTTLEDLNIDTDSGRLVIL